MSDKILIFGKNTWPFTIAAREAYAKAGREVEYFDVLSQSDKLDTMLKYSSGKRKVPVIVEDGKILIGHNGKAWRV